ncbi:Protein Syd [Paraglaciecola mesophila]|uniref:Protein Syd n=1 Tax=Paraglaciecola mesophila TaxID=197222 RepID=A0A857JPR2_9ALTE|nr:SecY-interacting protein [Paraglaciecola mesophila]QHJ13456.1 Protein Syd [Paraglaciecola mesophila]
MSSMVNQALDDFMARFAAFSKEHCELTSIEFDPDWPSACYQATSNSQSGELVSWQPIVREHVANFEGLNDALEIELHPDIVHFYSRYWSDNIVAEHPSGKLQILQAWNAEDFDRLQQNIVGHILMKRRLRQPETVFIALTDEEDFILSVENQTGAVMLEQVGLQPKEQISADLATFLAEIEPALAD